MAIPDTTDLATRHIASANVGPLQAGTAATALRDLSLAVGWCDLRVVPLQGTHWTVLVGHKRKEDPLRAVLPLPLHTNALVPSQLHAIFAALLKIDVSTLPAPVGELAPSVETLRAEYVARQGAETEAPVEDKDKGVDVLEEYGLEKAQQEEEEEAVGDAREKLAEEHLFDPDTLYVAIGSADSTVVYYKLSRGIRKPHDIPDE